MQRPQDVEEILRANIAPAEDGFINFVLDIVDHNLRTFDEHKTFHWTGFMAIVTNIGTLAPEPSVRLQLNNYVKIEELVKKEYSHNTIRFFEIAWFEFIHI